MDKEISMRELKKYTREIDREDIKRFDEVSNADKIVSDINLVRLEAIAEGESVLTTKGVRYTKVNGEFIQESSGSGSSVPSSVIANSHTHGNKNLLDTYTQSEEDLADAVLKKHDEGSDIQDASEVSVDTTNFTGNLSSADDTVQKALETLDELVAGSSDEDAIHDN